MLSFFLFALCFTGVLAGLNGPNYPRPLDLTSKQSLVSESWKPVNSQLEKYLYSDESNAKEPGVKNVTFSAGVFSLHDPNAAESLQFHHTSADMANNPNGTKKVDGNSIYKAASVTKVFTVLAALLELDPKDLHRPLTDIFPSLAEFVKKNPGKKDPTKVIQWDKITPWALAAQVGGAASQGLPSLDILHQYEVAKSIGDPTAKDPVSYGLPRLDLSALGPCSSLEETSCSKDKYLGSVQSQPPNFLPWATPSYSNGGFIMLGLVLAELTGKPIGKLYRDAIFERLDMKDSMIDVPSESLYPRSAIVDGNIQVFSFDGGITRTSGGLFSTINDLAKFGVGILNNTLLSPEKTRQWMKPVSHTASLTYTVGAPWEIVRYIHKSSGHITDIYTKLGDSGPYGGCIVLIPEYDAGFSVLSAHSNQTLRGDVTLNVLDIITENVVPALEAQAAKEAENNLVGRYVSTDKGLNSSLTVRPGEPVSAEEQVNSGPGLVISSWISNGTDMLEQLHGGAKPALHPSIVDQGDGKIAFRASSYPQTNTYVAAGEKVGPFTGAYGTNFDWIAVDGSVYGGIGTDLFVFDVDERGSAVSVSPSTLRVKLEKRKERENDQSNGSGKST